MKYWASFAVCLLVPSKRQKSYVRQQKDKNVNTCAVFSCATSTSGKRNHCHRATVVYQLLQLMMLPAAFS